MQPHLSAGRASSWLWRLIRTGSAVVALHVGTVHAVPVTATFEGPVSQDSGLGLIGQTMTLTLTYDDASAPSFGTNQKFYSGAVSSATVMVGTNRWTFNTDVGFDDLILTNDYVQSFAAGVEDSFQLFLGDFSGPDLGTATPGDPVDPSAFGLSLFLYDADPTGSPDALEAAEPLPNPPPDVADFSNPARTFGDRVMQFEWTVGDGEIGTRYVIETRFAEVSASSPKAVPALPFAATVLLSGLLAGLARARPSRP